MTLACALLLAPALAGDWTDFPQAAVYGPERVYGGESTSGQVIDGDGQPVVDVEVIAEVGDRFLARAFTDEHGRFSLHYDLADGEVARIHGRKPGAGIVALKPHPKGYDWLQGVIVRGSVDPPEAARCDPGPLAPLMARFAPGVCLGMTPGEVAERPLSMNYLPLEGTPVSLMRLDYLESVVLPDLSIQEHDGARQVVGLELNIGTNREVSDLSPYVAELTALMDAALGERRSRSEHFPGRPHGDAYCGTPTPSSDTVFVNWDGEGTGFSAYLRTMRYHDGPISDIRFEVALDPAFLQYP